MTEEEVKGYVDLIDTQFYEAKRRRISRMSVDWGKWSREMNLELRVKERKADKKAVYTYIFMYWLNRSQLLEEYYKHRGRKIMRKRSLQKEGNRLRSILRSGKFDEDISDKDKAEMVLKTLRG